MSVEGVRRRGAEEVEGVGLENEGVDCGVSIVEGVGVEGVGVEGVGVEGVGVEGVGVEGVGVEGVGLGCRWRELEWRGEGVGIGRCQWRELDGVGWGINGGSWTGGRG